MSSLQSSLRPPRGSRDAKDERQRLEHEYTEMNAAMILPMILNRRRLNALAPISYLPLEVLRHIFSLLQHEDRPDFDGFYELLLALSGPNMSGTVLGWIGITHVCSQWRHLAIETPLLWCYIPLASNWNPHWIQTFLTRSRSAPLSITQSLGWRGLPKFSPASTQSIIHDHLFHVQDLHIAGYSVTLDCVLSELSKPAYLLESAVLAVHPMKGFPQRGAPIAQMPWELFAGNAPCLRTLCLTNCAVFWDSPSTRHVVRNLTILKIYLPHGNLLWSSGHPNFPFLRDEILPSLAQLLDILEASPSLERLSLDGVLPDWSLMNHYPSSHDARIISLPHLDTYYLSGNTYDCLAVSRHIRASPRTQISLTCSTSGSGDELAEELSAILLRLKDHISHCDHSPTFCSFISLRMEEHLEIQTNPYTLTILPSLDPSVYTSFVQGCLSLWPVSTPTHLKICGSSGFGSTELIRVFSTEALQSCVDKITLQSIRDLSVVLFEQSKSHAAPPLPGLQEITLQAVDLEELTRLEICNVLMLRKQAGMPIRRLKLEYCNGMSRSWVKQLESDFGVELSCDDETRRRGH